MSLIKLVTILTHGLHGVMAVLLFVGGVELLRVSAQPLDVQILANEHRLSVLETQINAINERLSRIETLGYGVVGASALQLFGLFYRRGRAQ